MEKTIATSQLATKSVNIDLLEEEVTKQYPQLAEISADICCKENEIKELVHAFYERKKANIKVGEEVRKELNNRFIKLLQEKKQLEQIEFQEKLKTPEYQAIFSSLRSKK
jgi:hypothetical protein